MRTAEGEVLEMLRPILCLPYRRKVKWKGERLEKELLALGYQRCRGKTAYRKHLRSDLSIHIICYEHGCFYHIDNH